MTEKQQSMVQARGGCLCGAVRYEIRGKLRDVVVCHCSKCRRFHGHVGAYTSIPQENLVFKEKSGLKWYDSIQDETPGVMRGFCRECGSSLFWNPTHEERIAVAAGSIDEPTQRKIIGHVWVEQKGDYHENCDGLVQYSRGWGSDELKE
jgi:hypothetical protein